MFSAKRTTNLFILLCSGIPNGRISTSNEPDVNEIKEQLDNIQLNASRNGTDNLLMNSVLGIVEPNIN